MKTVYCIIKNGEINGADCYIVCDVAEGYIKPTLLPKDIIWNEEQRERCKKCQYHDDVEA